MPHPLRLGLLFEYPSLNGGEYSLLSVLRELGDQVTGVALVPAESPVESALRALPFKTLAWEARHTTDDELIQLLRGHQVDVWHANSLAMSRRLGRIAGETSTPLTGHLRDIIKLSGRAVEDINQLHRIICVSRATRDFHLTQGLSTERSTVIYNGIDLTRFSPATATGDLHKELQLPPETKLILNVGQICLRKGQDTFVEVAIELARQDKSLHFLHCGARHSTKAESVAFDARLDDRMHAVGLAHRWHRLGIRTDLPLLLREVHLLLHCARQEPLGRVLLESLASGTAIVATRVGGTAEIVRDGLDGLLAEPDDVPGHTAAALSLLGDREYCQQLVRQGRQRCEELFDVRRAARETLAVWRGLRDGD